MRAPVTKRWSPTYDGWTLKLNQAFVVLGVHRSGTSAMAGILDQLGLAIPKTLIPSETQNPKGFFESRVIARFNDLLLAYCDATWSSINWTHALLNAHDLSDFGSAGRRVLLSEYGNTRDWMVKDPRICRLFPFWAEVLDQLGRQPKIIFVVRHPKEVAASLQKRNSFSLKKGLLIWLLDTLHAEFSTRKYPRVFLRYPAFCEEPLNQVIRIQDALDYTFEVGPQTGKNGISTFIESGLRHNRENHDANLLPFLRRISGILFRWSRNTEDEDDHAVLDRSRNNIYHIIERELQHGKVINDGALYDLLQTEA